MWALLCLMAPMASEETTEEETTVTAQVSKTCPNNDEYCLECTSKICIRCGASFWDPNSGTCKPPKVRIDNCKNMTRMIFQTFQYPILCVWALELFILFDSKILEIYPFLPFWLIPTGREYFNETECRYCKDGYRPDAAGACIAIEYQRCASVIQNVGTCDYCLDGLKVVNGSCNSEDTCDIDNCEVCRRDGGGSYKCARCKSSYGLNSNSECVEFAGGGCEIANTETVCKVCRPGYYYKDGLCEESDFSGLQRLSEFLILALPLFVYYN